MYVEADVTSTSRLATPPSPHTNNEEICGLFVTPGSTGPRAVDRIAADQHDHCKFRMKVSLADRFLQ